MTSATLSKWVVFKGAISRLKWLGILYLALLILEIPLPLWMMVSRQKALHGADWMATRALQYSNLFHPLAHLTNLAMAIVTGMILFHYLQKERENTFFHSLPIRRTMLYWQNLLAGLVLLWVPLLITAILISLVTSGLGISQVEWLKTYITSTQNITSSPTALTPVWEITAFWIFFNCLMTAMFLVITVGAGMLTGNALLQGALTLIGMFLPLGLYFLIQENLLKLLYGFPRGNDHNIEWFSPFVSYFTENNFIAHFANLKWYALYLAITVLLIVLSVYLYKNRKAEAAGETLAADWIRWVFKYGVSVCAALTGGIYFASFNGNSRIVLYIGYAVGALMGFIVADIIAHKSFHFYRRWKGLLIFGALFALLVVAVKADVIGYQTYVPEPGEVQEVVLGNLLRDNPNPQNVEEGMEKGITDKATINLIRRLHQEIINRQEQNLAVLDVLNQSQQMAPSKTNSDQPNLMGVRITYVLGGGSRVSRNYTIDLDQYREFLYPVFSSKEVKRNLYSQLFQQDSRKLDELNLNNFRLGRSVRIYKPAELKEALEALKQDALNISYEAAVEGKVPPQATIDFVPKGVSPRNIPFNFTYYREFTNFETFLNKHGYLEELFLDPQYVDRIEAGRQNTKLDQIIRDKAQIKLLLERCNLSDARQMVVKPDYVEAKGMVQYYGKIYKKDGSSIFVSFDGGPDNLSVLQKFLR